MAPRIQVVVRPTPPPTLELRPRWPGCGDHFSALFRSREIGRIYEMRDASPPQWRWQIIVPMAMPDWTQGACGDPGTAKAELEAAWGRLLGATPPARLQRAWEFEDAAMKRAEAESNSPPEPAQPQPRPADPPSLQALLAQADSIGTHRDFP